MCQLHSASSQSAADPSAQLVLRVGVPVEVLAGAEQTGEQKRGLDEIAAVVLAAEGNRLAGVAVQEMRQDAVIAVGPEQKAHHGQQALGGFGRERSSPGRRRR